MKQTAQAPSNRRLDYHFIAMQCGFWAMFGGMCGYQAALLLARGFTSGQIGVIIAVRCLSGVVFQPLLGGFADKHPEIPLRRIVGVSLGISFLVGLWFLLDPGMGLEETLVVFAVIGGLELSSYPLMDSMAIQYISSGVPIRYSLARGAGSLSYAVLCVLLGLQVGRWGTESVLITHACLVVVEFLLVSTYPVFRHPAQTGEEAVPKPKPQPALSLLRQNPSFALTLVGVLFGLTAVLPMSNFMIYIIHSRGGSDGSLGIALFLMAASEMPTAFFFQKLLRRFGSSKLLVISMFFVMLRAIVILFSFNLGGILIGQPLQMLGYGLFTPTSVFYVNESVPVADRVKGQTLMMVASNGMGGVVSSVMGGWALNFGGPNFLLLCCVACGAVSMLLVWLGGSLRAKQI